MVKHSQREERAAVGGIALLIQGDHLLVLLSSKLVSVKNELLRKNDSTITFVYIQQQPFS